MPVHDILLGEKYKAAHFAQYNVSNRLTVYLWRGRGGVLVIFVY